MLLYTHIETVAAINKLNPLITKSNIPLEVEYPNNASIGIEIGYIVKRSPSTIPPLLEVIMIKRKDNNKYTAIDVVSLFFSRSVLVPILFIMLTPQITGCKKQSEVRETLFAVRVNLHCYIVFYFVCWVKLNQLPELSMPIASIP